VIVNITLFCVAGIQVEVGMHSAGAATGQIDLVNIFPWFFSAVEQTMIWCGKLTFHYIVFMELARCELHNFRPSATLSALLKFRHTAALQTRFKIIPNYQLRSPAASYNIPPPTSQCFALPSAYLHQTDEEAQQGKHQSSRFFS